ncbi:hypothetical protein SO802_029512 [Lithocarpus litseifolius]|uniref:Uncharacterized protein n=1 Tax=Lithocarpus litseifolius TaxID=425828 RepID=A0AAW2BUD5_9ROSI
MSCLVQLSLFRQLTRFYYFFFCSLLGPATSLGQHQQNWAGRIISFILGRLVVGQSVRLWHVVPILGVPDALVPLDLPVGQLNLLPGETIAVWVSIDVPSTQAPGQYEGEVIITAVKTNAE